MDLSRGPVLILGANGMLGHELMDVFSDLKPIAWDRDQIDITDAAAVQTKLTELKPIAIVNAAAYTAVDQCETEEAVCTAVNGTAVGYLADAAKTIGAKLVHISTDYVFDGTKAEGYTEADVPGIAVNAYGRSKRAGEELLLKNHPDGGYVVRTAWLYGKSGKNFVETMLAVAAQGKKLNVVDDQTGSPTYARDLAQQIRTLLEGDYAAGIYHATNAGQTTWYGFAKEIFARAGVQADLHPCTSAEFPRPAKRPAFSVLLNTRLPALRSWEEGLTTYLASREVMS